MVYHLSSGQRTVRLVKLRYDSGVFLHRPEILDDVNLHGVVTAQVPALVSVLRSDWEMSLLASTETRSALTCLSPTCYIERSQAGLHPWQKCVRSALET